MELFYYVYCNWATTIIQYKDTNVAYYSSTVIRFKILDLKWVFYNSKL